MQSFFNENWAHFVQCISLPLEITGFTLALIELIRPQLADSIENIIDALGEYNFTFNLAKKFSDYRKQRYLNLIDSL